MDGLLIDSEVLWHEAEIEILGGLGVPLDPDGCRSTKGMFVDEVTAHWHGHYPWAGPPPDQVAVADRRPGDRADLRQGRAQARCLRTPSTCVRQRGWALAVASSSQYRLIEAALDHFGLLDRFDLVHSAEDEEYGKPHPAVFVTAATQAAACRHGSCLVWEDAPAGVLAAKAASMACIAVPEEGEGDHPAFGLADLVVRFTRRGGRRGARTPWPQRHFGP